MMTRWQVGALIGWNVACILLGVVAAWTQRAARTAPSPAPAPAAGYVASVRSDVVHRADCPYAARIKPANLRSYASLADALAEGYRPCRRCLPLAGPPQTGPATRPAAGRRAEP